MLTLEGITKYFGSQRVLTGINLELKRGEILGLVGPNGSGKSTLLKIVLGLVYQTEGVFRFQEGAERVKLGALPDKPGFFPGFSLEKNLMLFSGRVKRPVFNETIARLGLIPYLHKKFSSCSTGIQKRCELAAALMHQPELLVMDEPISGLDPAGVYAFRSLMRDWQSNNMAVLLTDHALKELEKLCTSICFLRKGIIQSVVPVPEITSKHGSLEEAYRFYNLKSA